MEARTAAPAAAVAAPAVPAVAASQPPQPPQAADPCPITSLVRGYLAMLMGPPATTSPAAAAGPTPPSSSSGRQHRSHRHHHHHRSSGHHHAAQHGDSGSARDQTAMNDAAPEACRKAGLAAAPATTPTDASTAGHCCPPSCCCPLHTSSSAAAVAAASSSALSSSPSASISSAQSSVPLAPTPNRFPSPPPASSAVPLTQWMTCLSEADLAWMRAQPCLLQASHRMRQQAEAAAAAAAVASAASASSTAASSTPVASVSPHSSGGSAHSSSSLRRPSPTALLPALAAPPLPIPSPGPSPAAAGMCQTDLFRSTMAQCDLDDALKGPSLIQCLRARQTHASPEVMRGSGIACANARRNGRASQSQSITPSVCRGGGGSSIVTRQRCPDPVPASASALQRSCTLAKGVPSWLRSMHHYESRVFGTQFDHAGRNLLVVTQDQHLRLYNLNGRGDSNLEAERERALQRGERQQQRRSQDYDAEAPSHVGSRIFDSRVSSDVASSSCGSASRSPRSSSAALPCLSSSSAPASASSRSTSAARVDAGWECTLDTRGLNVGWSIVSTDFSPDDSLVAYSTWSPLVHLISTDPSRKYLPVAPAAPEPVKSCFFSKLSPKCSSSGSGSSSGGTIGRASRLVPNTDGVTHIPLQFRKSSCVSRFCIFSVAFSPVAGDTLLGGASDRCFYLYDLGADRVSLQVPAHAEDVNAVLWMDDNVLLTGGDDKLIKVWDRRVLGGAPSAASSANGSSCGTPAAAASAAAAEPSACQSLLHMLCPSTRPRPAPVGCFAGHTQGLTSLARRGEDGRHILSNSKDQSAKIWDLRRMSRLAEVEAAFAARAASGADLHAAQSTGAGAGAAGGGGGGCSQWDYRWPTHVSKAASAPVDPLVKQHQQHAAQNAVAACLAALSPAIPASYIGAGAGSPSPSPSATLQHRSPPPALKPCALDTSLMTFTGHHVLETLIRAYFSPGASTGHRFVYAGSQSGAVLVWDALTGQCVRKLAGHYGTVRDVSWHPSLPMLVSSSWDCSIARWEVPPS